MSSDQLNISSAMQQLHSGAEPPFNICKELADRCADLLEQGDAQAVECLQLIADTYEFTESPMLRTAIENCFVYHLGARILSSADYATLLKRLPENLHEVLIAQMYASGI